MAIISEMSLTRAQVVSLFAQQIPADSVSAGICFEFPKNGDEPDFEKLLASRAYWDTASNLQVKTETGILANVEDTWDEEPTGFKGPNPFVRVFYDAPTMERLSNYSPDCDGIMVSRVAVRLNINPGSEANDFNVYQGLVIWPKFPENRNPFKGFAGSAEEDSMAYSFGILCPPPWNGKPA